jgi:hypothetical protein
LFRKLKGYLWDKIPQERYRRCIQCQELVRVTLPDKRWDSKALREHRGHRLYAVSYVSLREWFRAVRG